MIHVGMFNPIVPRWPQRRQEPQRDGICYMYECLTL